MLAGGGAPAGDLAQQVHEVETQLERPHKEMTLEIGEHRLKVTNLDKVMWPETADQRALTKRDLIAYYARMSPVLINQLRDRPLTMTRYPNGIDGSMFYQKHIDNRPDFVPTVPVFSEAAGEIDQDYVLANNLPTLLWLGQIADLALHSSLARANQHPDGHHLDTDFTGSREQILASLLNYPDFILFDLDPYIYAGDEAKGEEPELNRRAFKATVEVALWLKELLDGAGLSSFVKTSGATGLHIYVPVLRQYDYETIRGVATTIGGFILAGHPQQVTMEWVSEKRRGKVFFDANQNARIKSLAVAYSPRTKPGGPVSMPLRWTELDKVYPTEFHMLNAHERLEEYGDLWGATSSMPSTTSKPCSAPSRVSDAPSQPRDVRGTPMLTGGDPPCAPSVSSLREKRHRSAPDTGRRSVRERPAAPQLDRPRCRPRRCRLGDRHVVDGRDAPHSGRLRHRTGPDRRSC